MECSPKSRMAMPFNPFSSFRKYQKFWMAAILLVCMVTFVLCTGSRGGDFQDWIERLFGRGGGTALGKLDGRAVKYNDLLDLKGQRELANRFMRKSCE